MFCAVHWRVLTFLTTNVLALRFSSVTAFSNALRTRVWLPTLRLQCCLRILPTFWIIRRVVCLKLKWTRCLRQWSHLVSKFKWTQLSENNVFYSFNYCSWCDLLNFNDIWSPFWSFRERNCLMKTRFQGFDCRSCCCDIFTSVWSLFAFSALVLAFQRFIC